MEQVYGYDVWETGSDAVATVRGGIASGQDLAARVPVGQIAATGKFVAWSPAANDGSEKAVMLTAVAVDASAGERFGPLIKSGTFNPELVKWPDGITDVQKLTAFVGTPIGLQLPNG